MEQYMGPIAIAVVVGFVWLVVSRRRKYKNLPKSDGGSGRDGGGTTPTKKRT